MINRFLIPVLVALSFVQISQAKNIPTKTVDLPSTLSQDAKTAYYWSFYGRYSNNPEALGTVMSRMSDLTSRIFNISKGDAYHQFYNDVIAQGGPQVLLASVGIERVITGMNLGFKNEVTDLINATYQLNPELGASLSIMAFGHNSKHLDPSVRNAANPMKPGDIDRCLQSCALYQLGLQDNRFAIDTFAGNAKPRNEYPGREQQEMFGKFPNDRNGNQPSFRQGIDPRVASSSNNCVSVCTVQIGSGFVGGAYLGLKVGIAIGPEGPILAGLGLGVVGAAGGALSCLNSPSCGKSRHQEFQEEEASRLKADNDLREERLRSKEIERKEKEAEKAKPNPTSSPAPDAKQTEEKRKEEERYRQTEEKIKDSFDRNKNPKGKDDSSTSCEATKSCGDTMTAAIDPDYQKPKPQPMTDGMGRILTSRDLVSMPANNIEKSLPFRILTDKHGIPLGNRPITSMPGVEMDNSSSGPLTDAMGRILTNRDLTSTPNTSPDIPVSVPPNFGDILPKPK